MTTDFIQAIIDRAVQIATKAAMNRHPVKSITWCPPATAASDPMGSFAVEHAGSMTASDTPPWEA